MVISELINVIFWKDIKKCVRFYQELSEKYYPSNPDIFDRQFNDYIVGYVKTKEKFIAIINDVARKNPYDRHSRYMRLFDITESESKPLLRKARLYSGFDDLVETAEKYNLYLTGQKTYEPKTSHHRILYVFNKYKANEVFTGYGAKGG